MKKVLCILVATAMVIGVQAADDVKTDDVSSLGIGLNTIMYTGGGIMPAAVVRWSPGPIGGEILLGQMSGTDEGGGGAKFETSMIELAGKLLFTFIDRPNSDFYAGAKLGVQSLEQKTNGTKTTDETALVFGGLVGTEFRLDELPEIGFNFEIGYDFSTYEDDVGTPKYEGDHSGVTVALGATYYF